MKFLRHGFQKLEPEQDRQTQLLNVLPRCMARNTVKQLVVPQLQLMRCIQYYNRKVKVNGNRRVWMCLSHNDLIGRATNAF